MAKKKKEKEETEEKEEKKGGKLKWIIIIFVLLGLLGGGGFFAYKKFFAPKKKEEVQQQTEEAQQPEEKKTDDKQAEQQVGPTEIYTLPTLIVNLADPLGRRYLKISMDVELQNKKVVAELEKKLPQIKDSLIMLLTSKTFSDISTIEGKLELKNEIIARLTQILGKGKVLQVYFTEFVVQ
ncbi:MAG: flagellar basal body-associated FliL family protein [Desulfonauticus sp.]|nr:flagellar basal body-associated FliL family protein [Desulfonauticus sp.]